MSGSDVRPIQISDLSIGADEASDCVLAGLTMLRDGNPIAAGGLVLFGEDYWAVLEIFAPLRPAERLRLCRLLAGGLDAAAECGISRVLAYADPRIDRSDALLRRFGFVDLLDRDDGVTATERLIEEQLGLTIQTLVRT